MSSDAAAMRPPTLGQVCAVAAGNAIEFYDFLAYAFFAGQIGRTFFPSTHPGASLLASLATFGAGFLMRPVGAIVIGRIGDRIGRKPAMLLCFALMGLAMVALASIPAYSRIGMLAPVLVIACRLVQGFALGGDVGPSTAYLIEAAPSRRRGLYVAGQYSGQQAATMVAGIVGYVLARTLSDGDLDAWGWRIAFLAGALIIPFGLMLRRNLVETLAVPEAEAAEPAPRRPLALLLVLSVAMLASGTTVTYVLNYLTTYASETLHMPRALGFAATVTTGACGAAFALVGGVLSDRVGRKPVMMLPWILLLLATIPAFGLVSRERSAPTLLGMAAVLAISLNTAQAAILAAITESLPRSIRASALGLTYAVAISIFGGSTQFTVAWLTGLLHSPLVPAWYMTGALAIGLIAMVAQPETAPRQIGRDEAKLPAEARPQFVQ